MASPTLTRTAFDFQTHHGLVQIPPSYNLIPIEQFGDGPSTFSAPNGNMVAFGAGNNPYMHGAPGTTGIPQPNASDGWRLVWQPLVSQATEILEIAMTWNCQAICRYWIENRSTTDSGNYACAAGQIGVSLGLPDGIGLNVFSKLATLPGILSTPLTVNPGPPQDFTGPNTYRQLNVVPLMGRLTRTAALGLPWPNLDDIQVFRLGSGSPFHISIFPCTGGKFGTESWTGTNINNVTRFLSLHVHGTMTLDVLWQ